MPLYPLRRPLPSSTPARSKPAVPPACTRRTTCAGNCASCPSRPARRLAGRRHCPACAPPCPRPRPPPTASLEARREAVRLAYVRDFLKVQATALDPEALSRWHLLHLRAEALEAEAAALGALLGQG